MFRIKRLRSSVRGNGGLFSIAEKIDALRCEQNGKDPDEILDRLYESRSRERPRDQDGKKALNIFRITIARRANNGDEVVIDLCRKAGLLDEVEDTPMKVKKVRAKKAAENT